jgi:hypothetical protein
MFVSEAKESQAAIRLLPDLTDWPMPVGIPSLEDLNSKNILDLTLRSLMGQHPLPGRTLGSKHFANFVRVVDKAVREYEYGRLAAGEFVDHMDEGRLSAYFRSLDHFESCVGAAYRALSYCDRLRRFGEPVVLGKRRIASARESLRVLRDRIEHADQDIAQGSGVVNEVPFLVLTNGRIVFGNDDMSYSELAEILRLSVSVVNHLMTLRDEEAGPARR